MYLLLVGLSSATPPITEPMQDGDFCNKLKVAGTGTFEVGVSVKDKELALEYSNFLYGDGDLELDTGTVEAQRAAKLPGMEEGSSVPLNLYEKSKLTFSGKTPMVAWLVRWFADRGLRAVVSPAPVTSGAGPAGARRHRWAGC